MSARNDQWDGEPPTYEHLKSVPYVVIWRFRAVQGTSGGSYVTNQRTEVTATTAARATGKVKKLLGGWEDIGYRFLPVAVYPADLEPEGIKADRWPSGWLGG